MKSETETPYQDQSRLCPGLNQQAGLREIYPFLEALLIAQVRAREALKLDPVSLTQERSDTNGRKAFAPQRWDFPLDPGTPRPPF